MTPEEFDRARHKTIEMLHPEYVQEMRNCAEALDMGLDELMEHLEAAADDPGYYHSMGDNERYNDYDWDLIWGGWELLTGRTRPVSPWGPGPRGSIFSCAC